MTTQAIRSNVPALQSSPSADYLAILSTFPGMAFRRRNDKLASLEFVSEGSRQLLGIAPEELTSGRRSYLDLIHPDDRQAFATYFAATLSGVGTAQSEYRVVLDDGTIKWVSGKTHAVTASDGTTQFIHGYVVDITEKRLAELRDRHRVTILAALATRAPLKTVLDAIVRSIEAEEPSIACSIMLLDESGRRLTLGAAPSLPPSVQASLDGTEVSARGGPASVAVLTGQRVVIHDLRAHPIGATQIGQRMIHEAQRLSTWAEPIIAPGGRLLGAITTLRSNPHTSSGLHGPATMSVSRWT